MKKRIKIAALLIAQALVFVYMLSHIEAAVPAEAYAGIRSVMTGAWFMIFLFTLALAGELESAKQEWACIRRHLSRFRPGSS